MKTFLILLLVTLAPGLLSLIPYSDLFGNNHYQTEQEALNACIDWETTEHLLWDPYKKLDPKYQH